MDPAGRKALVPGASRGIGRATALLLAREGADVAINYASKEAGARDVEQEVRAMGRRALVLQADVGDGEQVEAMFRRIREQWGGLDVLVNNAGGRCDGPLLDVEESAWERALAVHLMGTVRCCRLALPAMIEKRDGVVVNLGSVAGLRGVRNAAAYGTAKAAVTHLTRCLALEVGGPNVKGNRVAPGLIDTDFPSVTPPAFIKHSIDNRIPLHRVGRPKDIAQAILYLIKSDYVTGEVGMV